MKIKLTSVYVNDQEKALRFYTEVLGFAKKADFSQGPFRWLTVTSPEEPDGTELQLALDDDPAAKAFQQARFQQKKPAVMLYTDDVKGDCERIKARGVGRARHDRRDLVERHPEQIVEHEGQPLGRLELVEDDQQGEADRVGEHQLLFGVGGSGAFGAQIQRLLVARRARAQHVEADAPDDRGQPAARVRDVARIGAVEAQPRLLEGVVGLGERAEHAIRDPPQVAAMLLEVDRHDASLQPSGRGAHAGRSPKRALAGAASPQSRAGAITRC